jgi:glycosyltransferase involved in cell wall biosynthesis
MKVLWISLRLFENSDEKQTAVWLKALAVKLSETPNLQLANVSKNANSKDLKRCDFGAIQQWALPGFSIDKRGLPPKNIQAYYNNILNEFKPDIIQIWGSENPLKLLPFIHQYSAAKVLTMQGVLGSIADRSLIGLTFKDIISTIGIREIIKRQNIYTVAQSFNYEAVYENEMIKQSGYIITQSNWTDSQIRHINRKAIFYRVQRELRNEFVSPDRKWTDFTHETAIVYSAAIGYTLKGLHSLIRAISIVKQLFPNVELRLAGLIGRKDWLGDGYLRFILKEIKKHNLEGNIVWLGPIAAKDIVKNLQEASVFVNPSLVESYSMVVAEAMAVGTPSVISFAGAMPELATSDKEALFFTPGDYKQLACNIIRLLTNEKLSKSISIAAQSRSNKRVNENDNAAQQYQIYQDIFSKSNQFI